MGARCSKAAKPKSPPSSRHYVSVGCLRISFPRKNKRSKRKQDSAEASHVEETCSRAENAMEGASGEDFNDQPSTSGFVEFTEVIPISLRQDSWEDVSQPRQRYAGTITRLKKKDSTRRPTYKDEIMLSDNIDSIVEKEIPEIADDELEGDIECIYLGDDIPAMKSNKVPDEIEEGDLKSKYGISSVYVPPLKERLLQESMDEEDIRVETEIQQMLKDGPFQRAKTYSTITPKIENDSELEMNIAYIMSDDDFGEAELNGELSCGKASPTAKTQQPTGNSKQRAKKEGKLHNVVDGEPVEDIALIRNNDVVVNVCNRQISSEKVSSTKMTTRSEGCPKKEKTDTEEKELENDSSFILNEDVLVSDSNGQLIAGTISPSSPKERTDPGDEKLTEDIKEILSDEVVSSESNGQISSCPVSAMKRRKSSLRKSEHNNEKVATDVDNASREHITADNGRVSPKQASPKERVSFLKINHADNNLAKNVQDDHLNRNISSSLGAPPLSESPSKSQVSSKKASPKKRVSFQEINLTDDDMAKDFLEDPSNGNQLSSLARLPPPEKEFTRKHSKQADEQLERDISFILNDDIFSVEPEIPGSSTPPKELPRPKTSNPKLSLAMDMDRIFDPDSIDDNLEDDIEYILNDDHLEVPPNEPISLRSDAARHPKKPSIKTSKQKEEESPHTNQYSVQDKAVQGSMRWIHLSTSNESISSSPNTVSCLSKRDRTRKSKRTATVEVAEETKTLIDPSSPRLVRHPRTISERTRAILEGKAMPKDVDYALKEDLNASDSIRPTSHTSSSLPRPKTRNPKRALDMNLSGIQGSSPTTYISRSVARPRQDFTQRPMQATSKLTSNGSVQGTSSEKTQPSAKAVPRDNTDTKSKPKDVLMLEDVDTSPETASSSSVELRSSKTSIREQNYAMKTSKRQPKEKEEENLDDIINEILEISNDGSATSGKNPSASGKTFRNDFAKPNQSKNTEEDDLKEAISDILNIPMDCSCASGNNRIASGTGLRKNSTKQLPKQSNHTEEVNLNEAINDILNDPIDGSGASGKTPTVPVTRLIKKSIIQTGHLKSFIFPRWKDGVLTVLDESSRGIETTPNKTSLHKSRGHSPCSSPGMVYEIRELELMEQIERESEQTPVGVDVSNTASPNGKASVSSVESRNHSSGCSVASGDNVRPMAAGSAEISTMPFSACPNTAKLSSYGKTRQQPMPSILKKENTVRKPRMSVPRETAVPLVGSVMSGASVATQRKPAVSVTGLNSHRTFSGITYESDEVMLMEQIEKESLRL